MSWAMNHEQRRAAKKHLAAENKKWPEQLVPWAPEDWPSSGPPGLVRVFRSRHFLVQEFKAVAPAIARLSVNRTAIDGKRWVEGVSWDELQAIKKQCGYGDHDAVEVFPRDVDVVNVANMRHLWILDQTEPLRFAWRAS